MMSEFLVYILKSTFCLSLLHLGFRTVMRKEAYFALNRMVLIAVIVFSFIIPLLYLPSTIKPVIREHIIPQYTFFENQVQPISVIENTEKIISAPSSNVAQVEKPLPYSTRQIIFFIYLAGMLFSFFVFIHGIVNVLLMLRKAKAIKKDGIRTFILEKDVPAFSFWKMIFISRADYMEHGSTILSHEQQHIRLGHFYDLLLMEMAKMVQWFNPVIYWLIQDLKAIHEYQADRRTLTKGIDAKKYQLLIIEKGVGHQKLALANSFNHCQIKKRITMMNQSKIGKAGRWKVATFLPLLALLLMAFGRTGEKVPMEIKSTQVESPSIMGTWKLAAYSYGGTWEDLKPVSPGSERIKFITEKNFNWVQYAGTDKIVVNSAGGTYTFSGNDYTERIEFGGQGMAGFIGKEHKFKVSIHKDKMELSGELASGLQIKEVWVRYQPSDKTTMNESSTASPYIDRMFIYLRTDGKFRYNSDPTQVNAIELEEKLKSELIRNPKLQIAVLIEEGIIDERVNQVKEILKNNGNPEVSYSHLHIEKGEKDSNGNQSSVWISKPMDIK